MLNSISKHVLKVNICLALLLASFCFNPSFAAEVLKVKGDAILIDTAGDDIKMGATYYLISGDKKKGIVKILKLRPGQALGKLLKGKALPNWILRKRTVKATRKVVAKKRKPKAPAPKSIYSKKKRRKRRGRRNENKTAIGVAVGMNNNSSTVNFVDGTGNVTRTDDYAGSNTSFELLADYQLYNKFFLRGSLGMQSFVAGGDPNNTQCVDTSTGQLGAICQIDLGFMNLDIWLRYKAIQYGRFDFWIGAGAGILFSPKYNSTTAIKEDDLATTVIGQVGAGADIQLTEKLYMPIWGEYALFPPSDTVDMSSASVYFGLAYKL